MVRQWIRRGDGWVIGFTPTYSGRPADRTSAGRNPRGNDGRRLRAGAYRAAAGPAVVLPTGWGWRRVRRLRQHGISPPQGHACHAAAYAGSDGPPALRQPPCLG